MIDAVGVPCRLGGVVLRGGLADGLVEVRRPIGVVDAEELDDGRRTVKGLMGDAGVRRVRDAGRMPECTKPETELGCPSRKDAADTVECLAEPVACRTHRLRQTSEGKIPFLRMTGDIDLIELLFSKPSAA